ncbi:MAG: glycosyltransferase [Anaerolineales bacterium]|jgi:glycosyltransferase involved in cell wall biosynthesis
MRVLVITNQLPTPGHPATTTSIARQINSIRAQGVQVDVLEIGGISFFKYFLSLPKIWRRLSQVDLLHAHYGYCGWVARLQFRRPVVVTFMGSDVLGARVESGRMKFFSYIEIFLNKILARLVDAVIVMTEQMAQQLKPVRSHVISYGIDVERFHPMDKRRCREQLGWDQNRRYILFPANPDDPNKNFLMAREVFEQLKGRMNEPMEMVALKGVLADHVPLYMNACDLMLMVSHSEGSPNVVKEAMACNLPIVGVAVGDTAELLNSVPGYRVVERSVNAVTDAAHQLLIGSEEVQGRRTLLQKGLDLDQVASRVIAVYREVLE